MPQVIGDSTNDASKLMKREGVRSVPSFHFWKGGKKVNGSFIHFWVCVWRGRGVSQPRKYYAEFCLLALPILFYASLTQLHNASV